MTALVTVRNLNVAYKGEGGFHHVLRNISFVLGRERLGIVGESGSGKSTTGRALMGLLPSSAIVSAETLEVEGTNLLKATESKLRKLRGRKIAMVLQDPNYSLNPTRTAGQQISDTYRVHFGGGRKAAMAETLAMLEAVKIRDSKRVYNLYPHELSGGMGQRVMIAMMLIAKPDVLIADEPTSALDVSVKREVISILDGLVRGRGMGLILISHDLNLVSAFCDRVLIMYGGRIMESADSDGLANCRHPYTRGLLEAAPSLENRRAELPQMQRDPRWMEEELP